ncbi:MAG: cellulase family glycosylhydrolase [Cyanobacteria bacterium]|nr:cellulase family glycosylhydrolase [Cyanobacteriota bacterium]
MKDFLNSILNRSGLSHPKLLPILSAMLISQFLTSLFTPSYGLDALPDLKFPDTVGVSAHIDGGQINEVPLMQRAGIRLVRFNIIWSSVERKKGEYDFSSYDKLIDALSSAGIRSYVFLGFGNPVYKESMSVRTKEGRIAFAKYAAAAVKRYKGKKIIWEIWNEPNLNSFWMPSADLDQYMELVQATSIAIKAEDPEAFVVGPALSGPYSPFFERMLRAGLLKWVDGISVHPYQNFPTNLPPEGVIRQTASLRTLVQRYASNRPNVPIIFSEWGYSWSGESNFNEQIQGDYAVRQYLIGMMLGIPVNMWYSWKNSRNEPCREAFKCFGLMRSDLTSRVGYYRVQNMNNQLEGYRFIKRLSTDANDYYLIFSDAAFSKMVVWTTGANHRSLLLPDGSYATLTATPKFVKMPKRIAQ